MFTLSRGSSYACGKTLEDALGRFATYSILVQQPEVEKAGMQPRQVGSIIAMMLQWTPRDIQVFAFVKICCPHFVFLNFAG